MLANFHSQKLRFHQKSKINRNTFSKLRKRNRDRDNITQLNIYCFFSFFLYGDKNTKCIWIIYRVQCTAGGLWNKIELVAFAKNLLILNIVYQNRQFARHKIALLSVWGKNWIICKKHSFRKKMDIKIFQNSAPENVKNVLFSVKGFKMCVFLFFGTNEWNRVFNRKFKTCIVGFEMNIKVERKKYWNIDLMVSINVFLCWGFVSIYC